MPTFRVTAPDGSSFAKVTADSPHTARQLILAELGAGPNPPHDYQGRPIKGKVLALNAEMREAAALSDAGYCYREDSHPDAPVCVVTFRVDGSSRLVLQSERSASPPPIPPSTQEDAPDA